MTQTQNRTPAVPLQAGECRITLTLSERELLHHILAVAREQPDVFGATSENPDATRYFAAAVARIQTKLPPRGAGTY